tara:strand:- start:33 stop:590 length:558 start_codon:yes stop_codon:yes gene_type:complete
MSSTCIVIPKVIKINCRDGIINMPYKIFENIYDFEWYFNSLIKNELIDNKNEKIDLDIWENKDALLSIFDSIKFNKLIIYNDLNLSYLLELCSYYCVPDFIIDELNTKLEDEKIFKINEIKSNPYEEVLKCSLCFTGFKKSENKYNSCKRHKCNIDNVSKIYICCGKHISSNEYCLVGYHIPSKN